jgi:hypothetical protein
MRPGSFVTLDRRTMSHGLPQQRHFHLRYISGVCGVVSALQPMVDIPAEMADRTNAKMKTSLRLGGLLGFVGGFLLAYQRSSRAFTVAYSIPSYMLISRACSPFLGLVGK